VCRRNSRAMTNSLTRAASKGQSGAYDRKTPRTAGLGTWTKIIVYLAQHSNASSQNVVQRQFSSKSVAPLTTGPENCSASIFTWYFVQVMSSDSQPSRPTTRHRQCPRRATHGWHRHPQHDTCRGSGCADRRYHQSLQDSVPKGPSKSPTRALILMSVSVQNDRIHSASSRLMRRFPV